MKKRQNNKMRENQRKRKIVRDAAFIAEENKDYGSEGSKAVSACPSGEGRLKTR
jgi:hypothetical protein